MKKKVSDEEIVLDIPKDIQELAQEFRQQKIKKERSDKLIKQKRKAKEIQLRIIRLKNGLKYATKIFLWAKALRSSPTGWALMENSHPPTAYSRIIFFDDHIVGVPWIGLGISLKGVFITNGGKGAGLFDQPIYSPEQLAESAETAALKMASEWIDNGQVWHCIKGRFNYSQDE